MRIRLLLFVFLLTMVSNLFAMEGFTETRLQKGTLVKNNIIARKYTLGPNDTLKIKVANDPGLSEERLKVQPDGYVNLGLIGEVYITGLTISEFKGVLTERYKKYIKNPIVSVSLINTKPFIVYVTGAVTNPGSYELNTSINEYTYYYNTPKPEANIDRKTPLLSNVLIAAGGIRYDADLENVKITNVLNNKEYKINLLELIENGDVTQDLYLTIGDRIHVPRLPSTFALTEEKFKKYASSTISPRRVPVRVYGYVRAPGVIQLDPADSLSINSAITSAGGYLADSAYAPKKIYLSRVDMNGNIVTKKVDPRRNDHPVLPNDIIYVPEKTRPLIGKAFDYMGRIIAPVDSFARGYNNWALIFDPSRFNGVNF